ncbi:MAG TPA: ATP synthase F1 subunit epsilon [Candidatus Eisenbacteria bacterium]|nr:ATP synthase F1 subunit epsilon [Candidatus Eisenbacteria bacterium]
MADTPFTFRLVTPQRLLLEAPIVSLEAPGSEGYLGILAHHAPLITPLRPGRLDVRDAAGVESSYAVSGGFLEVSANRATVLADTAERVAEIDRARAEASLKRAEARLQDASTGAPRAADVSRDVDRARAQRSLERAKNRLAIARG